MCVNPTGRRSAEVNAMADALFAVAPEKDKRDAKGGVTEMLGFQPDWHHEEHECGKFELRENCRVRDYDRCDSAGGSINGRACGHQEKMTELTRHRAGEVEIKEMTLPQN